MTLPIVLQEGRTALMFACKYGQLETCRYLLYEVHGVLMRSTYDCTPQHVRWQAAVHTVSGGQQTGALHDLRLQHISPTVAASMTYGCRRMLTRRCA